jgi:hypothetical protein
LLVSYGLVLSQRVVRRDDDACQAVDCCEMIVVKLDRLLAGVVARFVACLFGPRNWCAALNEVVAWSQQAH